MNLRKSVVLVTVDCLRADHVGFMGYQLPTTPYLDELAQQSFVVPTAIVAGAPTYYSFPGILASRHALALGRDILGLAPGEATLASAFRQAGYATAGFLAANPYLTRQFGYNQGFDHYQDFIHPEPRSGSVAPDAGGQRRGLLGRLNRRLEQLSHKSNVAGAVYDELYFQYCQRIASPRGESLDGLRRFPAADEVLDEVQGWLETVGELPFFLWIHLMDTHAPFYPTDEGLEMFGERLVTPARARYLNSYWNRSDLGAPRLARHRDEVIRLYDSAIRFVDAQMKRLVNMVQDLDQWDDCIFAITADHGEEFLEHGGRFHSPSCLSEEIVHVPLLLRVPGVQVRQVATTPMSLLHLAPTLLDAAGVPSPADFQGSSCWPGLQGGEVWDDIAVVESVASCSNPLHPDRRVGPRALAVRAEHYKLIVHFDPPSERLYDLQRDPNEQSPLGAEDEKPVRRRLLSRARDHIGYSLSGRNSDARLRARLKDLKLQLA